MADELKEQGRQALKGYFETGDRPTQKQFSAMIDSFLNKEDDQVNIEVSETSRSIIFGDTEVMDVTITGKLQSDDDITTSKNITVDKLEQYGKYKGFCCETHRPRSHVGIDSGRPT